MLSRFAVAASRATAAAGVSGAAARAMGTKSSGASARVCGVLGAQWGDEGKGKLADVLAKKYDIVARFNGGANAGHTVVVGGKKFAFHLLPCGLVYPHTKNLLGNGCVIHVPSMFKELEPLAAEGVEWKGRLLVSDRAHLLFDFHKAVDGLLEERRRTSSNSSIGTTKQGIGPAYASKATRNAVRVGHLLHRDTFRERLRRLIEEHKAMYQFDYDTQAELDKYDELAPKLIPMIVDGVGYINQAYHDEKRILAEGANAAMLDLDFGTYPYVTSSSTTVGGICTGLGLPPSVIDARVGVVKAYTTRVGGGPFPTELTDARGGGDRPMNAEGTEIGLHLQKVGAEVGVTYANTINAFTSLNLTKLDVLDELEEIKVGIAYKDKHSGRVLGPHEYPSTLEALSAVEVEYHTLPGWRTSTRGITKFADLPERAQEYIRYLEKATGVRVAWIGTGPGREEMITRGFSFTD